MNEQHVEAEIRINAPINAIWTAWVDPVHLAGWFVDEAHGQIGVAARVTWIWKQMGVEVEYEVVDVEPGERFELRTESAGGGIRTTEVSLERSEGGHRVRVVESGSDASPAVQSGWQLALGLLKAYVEDYFGETVRSVVVMVRTDADPEAIVALHRTAEGLSQWLDTDGPLPGEGERVRLELEDGVVVDGRVLCRTATETSLTWPWIQGVLELKQFPVSDGRAVALRAFTWADEAEVDLEALQAALSRGLGRLADALA